jgi:hypothetical protein
VFESHFQRAIVDRADANLAEVEQHLIARFDSFIPRPRSIGRPDLSFATGDVDDEHALGPVAVDANQFAVDELAAGKRQ